MADPVAPPVDVVVPAAVDAAPAPAPIEAAPAVVDAPPPVEVAPAPVVAEAPAPVEPPAPAPGLTDLLKSATVDGPKDPPAPDAPAPVDAPPADKPVDAPAPDAPPPAPDAEAPPVVADAPPVPDRLAPLPEYKYEVPEGVNLTDELKQTFHTAIEDARNGNPQSLMDLHHQAITDVKAATEQYQRKVWEDQLQEWQGQVESDPNIGGDKFASVSIRGAQLRDNFVSRHDKFSEGWKADMNAFNEMLDRTGVGNHPALWRWVGKDSSVRAKWMESSRSRNRRTPRSPQRRPP